MKQYLESSSKRFYLALGDFTFSPVLQISTSIALDYSESIKKGENNEVFVITFPVKNNTALWLSVQYLINLFFENYVFQSKNRVKELNLTRGTKIDIFSTTAIFEKIDEEAKKLRIKFSDNLEAYCSIQNVQFVNLSNKKRISKYKNYRKKKEIFLNERNALARILDLNLNPNIGILHSKVILISGRGKAGDFRRMLKDTTIYDQSLADTILLDRNLIISPDFSCFKGEIGKESDKNTNFFIKAVQSSISGLNFNNDEISQLRDNVINLLENNLKSKRFLDDYLKLSDLLIENEIFEKIGYKLENLRRYHPGVEEDFLTDVSVIIVNDLQLLYENPNTVNYLTELKIPVVVISDRVVSDFKDLDLYNRVFNSIDFENSYRFNWDPNKIDQLDLQFDEGSKYIDHIENNLYLKSSNQKIQLFEVEKSQFDPVFKFFESKKLLSQFEEFELIQKAFYQQLRPLLYLIKNSLNNHDTIDLLNILKVFEDTFNQSSSGMDINLKSSIQDHINDLRLYIQEKTESKRIDEVFDDYFYQEISFGEITYETPLITDFKERNHFNRINPSKDSITFIGYPYREYYFKYIDESIFINLIQTVRIYLNQCESTITRNFLFRKFKSGYFIEKYPNTIKDLNHHSISSENQINSIINNILTTGSEIENDMSQEIIEDYEGFEKMLTDIRYSDYTISSSSSDTSGQYLLSCNVLHFEDSSYLFFPHNWRILVLKESISGTLNSNYLKIGDIAVGDIAVVVNVSRKSISEYLEKSGSMLEHLQTLESWKFILRDEYHKHNDINKLVDRLDKLNNNYELHGSPENYNVLRWLHDESILSPAIENLQMILALKFPKEEILEKAKEILSAKVIILKAKNKLDRAVKEKLSKTITNSHKDLEGRFQIEVEGIEVKGYKDEIIGIEKRKDLAIEYHSTMKFMK